MEGNFQWDYWIKTERVISGRGKRITFTCSSFPWDTWRMQDSPEWVGTRTKRCLSRVFSRRRLAFFLPFFALNARGNQRDFRVMLWKYLIISPAYVSSCCGAQEPGARSRPCRALLGAAREEDRLLGAAFSCPSCPRQGSQGFVCACLLWVLVWFCQARPAAGPWRHSPGTARWKRLR